MKPKCLHCLQTESGARSFRPKSQEVKVTFLYFKLSIIQKQPVIAVVVTISPNFSLCKIVVLPAASRPTIKIRISLPLKLENNCENETPISIYHKIYNLWRADLLGFSFFSAKAAKITDNSKIYLFPLFWLYILISNWSDKYRIRRVTRKC